jgi:hypothetical protein
MSRPRLAAAGQGASDADLVMAWRRGEPLAIGELLARHAGRAAATAMAVSGQPAIVDGLVDTAGASLVAAIDRGDGPRWAVLADLLHRVEALAPSRVARADDRAMVTVAFADLPDRWQAALWGTAVDLRSPERLGFDLGIGPSALTALIYRAKEGLVTRYVAAHLSAHAAEAGPGPCRTVLEQIAAHARGSLDSKVRRQADHHLDSCERCRAVRYDVDAIHNDLRSLLWPSLPTVPGAMSLLAADDERPAIARRRPPRVALVSAAAASLAVAFGAWVAVGALEQDAPDSDDIANATTISLAPPASSVPAPTTTDSTVSSTTVTAPDVAAGDAPASTLPEPAPPGQPADERSSRPAAPATTAAPAPRPAVGPVTTTSAPPTTQVVLPPGTPFTGVTPATTGTESSPAEQDEPIASTTTPTAPTTVAPATSTPTTAASTTTGPTTTEAPVTTDAPASTSSTAPERLPAYEPDSGEGYLAKPIV